MFDFGALPPEINSGRMYTGPGSAPMMVAGTAWDELAAELGTAAAGYSSVISELTSAPWVGPTSASMVSAVAPYVSWLSAVASQAEQTASQARAAAAAFESAFAMTVPPPLIAANRTLLMTLIATNFFGQNTPAIAATEAQYMEMWAQDAAAMYNYAGSSAIASELTRFTSPPNTTNPAAVPGQSLAVAQATATPVGNSAQATATTTPQLVSAAALPQWLQQLLTEFTTNPSALPWPLSEIPTAWNSSGITGNGSGSTYYIWFHSLLQIYNAYGTGYQSYQMAQQLVFGVGTTAGSGAWYPTPQFAGLHLGGLGGISGISGISGHGVGAVSAGAGQAGRVGILSVPAGWATPTSEAGAAVAGLKGTPAAAAATSEPLNGLLRGIPTGAPGRRAAGYGYTNKYGFRYSVLARPPSAG